MHGTNECISSPSLTPELHGRLIYSTSAFKWNWIKLCRLWSYVTVDAWWSSFASCLSSQYLNSKYKFHIIKSLTVLASLTTAPGPGSSCVLQTKAGFRRLRHDVGGGSCDARFPCFQRSAGDWEEEDRVGKLYVVLLFLSEIFTCPTPPLSLCSVKRVTIETPRGDQTVESEAALCC